MHKKLLTGALLAVLVNTGCAKDVKSTHDAKSSQACHAKNYRLKNAGIRSAG